MAEYCSGLTRFWAGIDGPGYLDLLPDVMPARANELVRVIKVRVQALMPRGDLHHVVKRPKPSANISKKHTVLFKNSMLGKILEHTKI